MFNQEYLKIHNSMLLFLFLKYEKINVKMKNWAEWGGGSFPVNNIFLFFRLTEESEVFSHILG